MGATAHSPSATPRRLALPRRTAKAAADTFLLAFRAQPQEVQQLILNELEADKELRWDARQQTAVTEASARPFAEYLAERRARPEAA